MRTGNQTECGKLIEMPKPSRTRAGLNHIGTYLDRETVEKVAILRARLGLDNSKLIKPGPPPWPAKPPKPQPLSRRHRLLLQWSRRRWPSSTGCRRRARSAR
jgi:hypothetical protein